MNNAMMQPGMEQPQAQPVGAARSASGTAEEAAIREKIRKYIAGMKQEVIISLASLPAEDALDMLTERLVQRGISEEDASDLAEIIYAEVLAYAQELTNMTVEELRAQGAQGADGAMLNQDTGPRPSVLGGQNA